MYLQRAQLHVVGRYLLPIWHKCKALSGPEPFPMVPVVPSANYVPPRATQVCSALKVR
eukprot:COSAG01_NODE_232_length_21016_cov_51.558876_19_plen_58_part_00